MNDFPVVEAIKLTMVCAVGLAVACGAILLLPESDRKPVVQSVAGAAIALASAMWVVWPTFIRELDLLTVVVDVACLLVMFFAIVWALNPSGDQNRIAPPTEPTREGTR